MVCQAYYAPKITEILNQFIMGSANTPQLLLKLYKQFNLSQSALHLVPTPQIGNMQFANIFEYLLKDYNMITIGIYRKHNVVDDDTPGYAAKSYVWLHPPRDI